MGGSSSSIKSCFGPTPRPTSKSSSDQVISKRPALRDPLPVCSNGSDKDSRSPFDGSTPLSDNLSTLYLQTARAKRDTEGLSDGMMILNRGGLRNGDDTEKSFKSDTEFNRLGALYYDRTDLTSAESAGSSSAESLGLKNLRLHLGNFESFEDIGSNGMYIGQKMRLVLSMAQVIWSSLIRAPALQL